MERGKGFPLSRENSTDIWTKMLVWGFVLLALFVLVSILVS